MDNQFNEDILKMTPAVGVSTLSFFGIPLSEGVYVLTAIYIIIQIICTIYKTVRKE